MDFTPQQQAGITGAGEALSLGVQAYGAYESYEGAKKSASAQNAITGLEQKVEGQRYQAMQLSAQRESLQQLRSAQQARATALSNATGQGAQFGSGLQGGYGQISGQSKNNLLGISQNLQIGTNIFGLDAQISQQKIAMANAQTESATGSGISSFGKSLGSAIGPMASLAALAL
jgi:hypothetical protein